MDVPEPAIKAAGDSAPLVVVAAPVAAEKEALLEDSKLPTVSLNEESEEAEKRETKDLTTNGNGGVVGGGEKSPEETSSSKTDATADSKVTSNASADAPSTADDTLVVVGNVKTVSLNNENDDRIDSIEVGGQGDVGGGCDVTATSTNSPMEINQVGGGSGDEAKDLEQSTMSKGKSGGDGSVVDSTAPVETSESSLSSAKSSDEVDKINIITENGTEKEEILVEEKVAEVRELVKVEEEIAKPADADKEEEEDKKPKELPDKVVVDEKRQLPLQTEESVLRSQKENSDQDEKEVSEKTSSRSEAVSVEDTEPVATKVDEKPSHPATSITPKITDTKTEEKSEKVTKEVEDNKIVEKLPEVKKVDEDKVVMDSLQVEDSQEGEVVAIRGGEVKKERCANSDQEENEIETIDIDTDDDDEEENSLVEHSKGVILKIGPSFVDDDEDEEEDSLIGPPVDEEDAEEGDDSDVIEEEEIDDVEEVESFGEEYEEFEVSDEEEGASQEEITLEEEGDEGEMSNGTTDEERFAEMKDRNRGVKRKMYGNARAVQQNAKERKISW